MRDLWRAACGRIDLDVLGRAFWMSAFSQQELTADQLEDMHPLRRLERKPPPEKTPEERAAESKVGWKLVRQFFTQKKR